MRVLYALCLPLLVASDPSMEVFSPLKCSVWDSECITNMVQGSLALVSQGLADVGLPSLDPVHVPLIQVNKGGLKAEVENVEYRGLSKLIVKRASLDKFSKQFRLRIVVPNLSLNGTYKAAGFFHSLPLNGKGDLFIRASNLEIDAIIDFDTREDGKGKKFNELNSYFYSFEVHDDIMVLMENLYFGDEVQSAATHSYIQKHWKLISAEYGRVFLKPLLEKAFNMIKNLLHTFPVDMFLTDF